MSSTFETDLLVEEIKRFFNNASSIVDVYETKGWTVILEADRLIIETKKNTYQLGIANNNGKYFWYLYPYKDTHFETEFVPGKTNFDLFSEVIDDNERD